jgi:ABC-2 type transport system ATP-binding protein
VINKGEIILVDEKRALMQKMGQKRLTLHLQQPLAAVPSSLGSYNLAVNGRDLVYTYDTQTGETRITRLLDDLGNAGIEFRDLETTQSSLEDIFVGLVHNK